MFGTGLSQLLTVSKDGHVVPIGLCGNASVADDDVEHDILAGHLKVLDVVGFVSVEGVLDMVQCSKRVFHAMTVLEILVVAGTPSFGLSGPLPDAITPAAQRGVDVSDVTSCRRAEAAICRPVGLLKSCRARRR